MPGGSIWALSISGLALAVAFYGAIERFRATRQAERLRFSTIIDDLNGLHLEQLKSPDGLAPGDFTDVINSRRELLSVQALSLLPTLGERITSSELRVLAHALRHSGYHADADRIWGRAVATAGKEGTTQALYAHRGHAYFLFSLGRASEGRAAMRQAVDAVGDDDHSLVRKIETLRFWAVEERALRPDGAAVADALLAEAGRLAGLIRSAEVRRNVEAAG